VFLYNWNEFIVDPTLTKCSGDFLDLFYTLISNCSSSVDQVLHEDLFDLFGENFLTKRDGHDTKQLEGSFSDSPLSIFGHIGKS
jgi:hypothetical protein